VKTQEYKRRLAVLCLSVTCALPLRAAASQPTFIGEEPAVLTNHAIKIRGASLNYTAELGRIAIRDVETGEPHGYMFDTAYRVASPRESRPVTFVWNGGPGAPSALLHFSVAGPTRLENGQLVDNLETWLLASDLVFVDPIGTGFSRPVTAAYDSEFYGTLGDVASVTEFVRAWCLVHGAETAPLFLVGESWGAGRAANVAYALEKRGFRVNGLVLISGGWGLNRSFISPELRSALQIVDMAVVALYHGRSDPGLGRDAASVRRAAETWARETYAPALSRIKILSDAERTAIVTQLARFTGLPETQIDRKTLVITPRQFRTGLLKGDAKELYIFDLRRTSAPEDRAAEVIPAFLRNNLGYGTSLPYLGLDDIRHGFAPTGTYPESVNERWNYATAKLSPEEVKAAIQAASASGAGPPRLGPPLPAIEEAIAINPRLKVLVAAGMYDGFLPCTIGEESERTLPPNLRGSFTFHCYPGGHAMYLDAPARVELSRDIEKFISHTAKPN